MSQYELEPVAPVDAPLDIEPADGEIVFIGPGSIAFSMTTEAAAETSRRLQRVLDAASLDGEG